MIKIFFFYKKKDICKPLSVKFQEWCIPLQRREIFLPNAQSRMCEYSLISYVEFKWKLLDYHFQFLLTDGVMKQVKPYVFIMNL